MTRPIREPMECVDCDGLARGALPRLMSKPRCRQCRENAREDSP